MKRIFTLAAIAMLLFSFSGQAIAYFEDGHIMRVVYDRGGTYEVVTDLGAGWDLRNPSSANKLFNAAGTTFSLSQLGISNWSNAYVAYFTLTLYNPDSGSQDGAWTSGPLTSQSNLGRQWNSFIGNAHYIAGMNYQSGQVQNVNLQANANSYQKRFGKVGRFSAFLPSSQPTGDQNLAALATDGYVDQMLYFYGDPNVTSSGVQVYTIRTYENGTSEINPSTVPLPGAVYFLGSGLLGLIGIRRRMAA
jgi:hypothetical protein